MITKKCVSCTKIIRYSCPADLIRRGKTGYCRKCYLNNFPKLDKHPHWKGGKTKTDSGYILTRKPDHPFVNAYGYVREHRLVMEKHLGRYLQEGEVIHHKDGDKTNNNISNLELTTQSTHCANHMKKNRKCTMCDNKHLARGFCKNHYWILFLRGHRSSL